MTRGNILDVLLVSAKLGLTSFGGPIAHLGYFHQEYVRRRRWLDEAAYADLVALCQFLPGPASSQVGIAVGTMRAGLPGAVAAWAGFTLPSVIMLILFAYLLQGFSLAGAGWIHGLKVVAVAVVAHAVLGMGRKLAPDKVRATIAVAAAALALLWQTAFSQVAAIIAAGLLGWRLYSTKHQPDTQPAPPRQPKVQPEPPQQPQPEPPSIPLSRTAGAFFLALLAALLILLPLLRQVSSNQTIALFDSFFRPGALVFGGGHVVLPLLERAVVPTGWVSQADFLAGYGAAQAVPGPLFTFAAYLGAMVNGLSGALVAVVAIFLPAFLLVLGALPFWSSLRQNPRVQGALVGVNAAVVGILLGALYDPLWTSAILAPADFALAAILFVMLAFWELPPWVVVMAGAVGGSVLSLWA